MENQNKGVFAFDIDGTLTHRLDGINIEVIEALENLHREGWTVALLTGRVFTFAQLILRSFHFPYFLALQNGADILEMPSRKRLQRAYLSREVIGKMDLAYEGLPEDYIIYAGIDRGDFCYYRKERYSAHMLAHLEKLQRWGGGASWENRAFIFGEEARFPLIKCFGSQEAMEQVKKKIKGGFDIEVSSIRDPIDPTIHLNLVTHSAANKGNSLQFLRSYTNAPITIGAGDDGNDLSLLQEVDIAIAIETAPRSLLEEADIIAKPPEKNGIVEAIEEALLRARKQGNR